MELYLGNKIDEEISVLLKFAINMIESMNENLLYNVTKEEFEENCKKNNLIS